MAEGYKPKDLMLIPWRVAMALQQDGWYLRAACPWIKRNGMPDSTSDRPTQCIETIFMLTKSKRCYYDAEAVKKEAKYAPGKTNEIERAKGYYNGKWSTPNGGQRNDGSFKAIRDKRLRRTSDWFFESWQGMLLDDEGEPSAFVVNLKGYKEAHFATFPSALITPCVLASTRPGDIILDPFGGSGTTAEVAAKHGRSAVLTELNPEYVGLAQKRLMPYLCEEVYQ